jgi:hypothetical protein
LALEPQSRTLLSSSSTSSSTGSGDGSDDAAAALASPRNKQFMITPEGLGFTSSVQRILQQSGRSPGYHRALSGDAVLDVQAAISSSSTSPPGSSFDVALVFDQDDPKKLVGLFTESDYIQVRRMVLERT